MVKSKWSTHLTSVLAILPSCAEYVMFGYSGLNIELMVEIIDIVLWLWWWWWWWKMRKPAQSMSEVMLVPDIAEVQTESETIGTWELSWFWFLPIFQRCSDLKQKKRYLHFKKFVSKACTIFWCHSPACQMQSKFSFHARCGVNFNSKYTLKCILGLKCKLNIFSARNELQVQISFSPYTQPFWPVKSAP